MAIPFRHTKHASLHETAPQKNDTRSSRRQTFQSFLKNNASKLKRSGSKREAQPQQPNTSSRSRKSQLFDIPSVVMESKREPAVLSEWGGKPIDLPRASKDSVAGQYYVNVFQKPSLAKPPKPRTSPKSLTEDDVARIFSGAPEFGIQGSRKLPRPRVTYRGKLDEKDGLPCDYIGCIHPTFSVATLANYEITEMRNAASGNDAEAPDAADYLMEVPSMMSLNGSEPGTVGIEYFLQMSISDSKLSPEKAEDMRSKHRLLVTAPEILGLRPLDLEGLIDRLTELGDTLHSRTSEDSQAVDGQNEQKAAEMYSDLFSRLLIFPEAVDTVDQPDTGFEVQINALVKVLDARGIWYDFSLVENRIRLGQILWPSPADDEELDPEEEPTASERDVALLQIALACELLVRLEISGINTASPQSRKVCWDLVLGLRFLHSLRVATKKAGSSDAKQKRNSVLSIATFVTAQEDFEKPQVEPILYPRHEKQQLNGLLKFAEDLAWPHHEEIKKRFRERSRRHSGEANWRDPYTTPVGTPGQSAINQAGYFQKRPQLGRTATAQSIHLMPAASAYGSESFDAGGWLSRSWLTGFVLPGESISHLLISTLLENSPAAVRALGDTANLYGGFVYRSRSYWSKSCVVGRVLAAANGASDCMGWISASSAPAHHDDGWVNLEVKDLPESFAATEKDVFARNSAFVREEAMGGRTTITDADFTWPVDGLRVLGNEARYHGFTLQPTGTHHESENDDDYSDGASPSPTTTTSIACLHFSQNRNNAGRPDNSAKKVTIPLLYDVYFLSSYPCTPTSFPPRSSRPSSPTFLDSPSTREFCHPLHTSYAVEIVPAATILADDFADTVHLGDETVVLDCRGDDGAALQLLARAWCAKVGENGLVARARRTCLGCCVREARGLGVKIVIRI